LHGGGNQVASRKGEKGKVWFEGNVFKQNVIGQPRGTSAAGTVLLLGQSVDRTVDKTVVAAYVRKNRFRMDDTGPIITPSNVIDTFIEGNIFMPNNGAATCILRCDAADDPGGSPDEIINPSPRLILVRQNEIRQANYKWEIGKYWCSPRTVIRFEENYRTMGGVVPRESHIDGGFSTGKDWVDQAPSVEKGTNPGFA
jgi:hypothetical protein